MMTRILMLRTNRRNKYSKAVGEPVGLVGQDGQDIDVGGDDGNHDDDNVDVDGEVKPEEICLGGQLASLLYSSTKTASSSLLMLEQDKPKTLPGILQPTIHKRIQNLRVSCILSFFKESSALLGQILVTRFIWLNVFGFFYMPSTEVGHLSVRVTYLRISFHRQCRRPGLFCHLCENSNPTGPSFVSL